MGLKCMCFWDSVYMHTRRCGYTVPGDLVRSIAFAHERAIWSSPRSHSQPPFSFPLPPGTSRLKSINTCSDESHVCCPYAEILHEG